MPKIRVVVIPRPKPENKGLLDHHYQQIDPGRNHHPPYLHLSKRSADNIGTGNAEETYEKYGHSSSNIPQHSPNITEDGVSEDDWAGYMGDPRKYYQETDHPVRYVYQDEEEGTGGPLCFELVHEVKQGED